MAGKAPAHAKWQKKGNERKISCQLECTHAATTKPSGRVCWEAIARGARKRISRN